MKWPHRCEIPLSAKAFVIALTLGSILLFGTVFVDRRRNPLVEGKRMSDWALALVREPYRKDEYWVGSKYMRVFRGDRDAAIVWLMAAVDYRPSWARITWYRFTQKLPKSIGKTLRPKLTFTANRWAGVLALSNLARERPDSRIPPFFLKCMAHENSAVRKVAAFESGPWLDPVNPHLAIEVLRLGLQDSSPAVQRDACRRIALSVSQEPGTYTRAAYGLLPRLREMNEREPHVTQAISRFAREASK